MKYVVRFFLNKEEQCEHTFEYENSPIIPRKGEIVNFYDWEPYEVLNVVYCYPELDGDTMLIDITAESCDYEYGMDEDKDKKENW